MFNVVFTFEDGHVQRMYNVNHVKGIKHNFKRPIIAVVTKVGYSSAKDKLRFFREVKSVLFVFHAEAYWYNIPVFVIKYSK